jgi:outer membrane autotransporter protein
MKNTQRLFLTTAFCALVSCASATASSYYKTGAVLGTGLGYSHLSSKTNDNFLFNAGNVENGSFKKSTRSNGFVADVFAGYRFLLKEKFIAGLNVTFTKDTNTLKTTHSLPTFRSGSTTKLYRQFAVTPELAAGYIFAKQWMAYLKLGLSISRFKLDNKLVSPTSTISADKTVTRVAFKPTLGLEYAMNNKASVFTDVSYEYIKPIKVKLPNPTGTIDPNATHDVKVRPHYFTAKVGVLYKF